MSSLGTHLLKIYDNTQNYNIRDDILHDDMNELQYTFSNNCVNRCETIKKYILSSQSINVREYSIKNTYMYKIIKSFCDLNGYSCELIKSDSTTCGKVTKILSSSNYDSVYAGSTMTFVKSQKPLYYVKVKYITK